MQIENIWNNIVDWFNDRSERGRLTRSFNVAARESAQSETLGDCVKILIFAS